MTTNSMRSLQQKDLKPYKTCINQVHMLSLPILSLNTKFQPNWLQSIKAREVFHFWAGWVVGWLGRLAYSNAHKSHIYVESFNLETP